MNGMARRPRIHYPGAVYHVMARGVDRRTIFIDDQDRHAFLSTLHRTIRQTHSTLIAYCLMGNHFHLAIRVGEVSLSPVMQRILSPYATTFNHRHDRKGHLFETRHNAKLCVTDSYLIGLIRYIHMNPVRAGLVTHPEMWPWSSYHDHKRRGLDPLLEAEPAVPDFKPWPKEAAPLLIRPERLAQPSLLDLTEAVAGERMVLSSDIRSRSRQRRLMPAKRLLIHRAIQAGYRLGAIADWINVSPRAVSSLIAHETAETSGQTPIREG